MSNKKKNKKKLEKKKITKRHRKASAWALREYLKMPEACLPENMLRQIEKHRQQAIRKVKYEPDRVVIWMG